MFVLTRVILQRSCSTDLEALLEDDADLLGSKFATLQKVVHVAS